MMERTRIEVFYDGACPLCRREMSALQRVDRNGDIRFTDIAAMDFDPSQVGVGREVLMQRIHARLPSGSLVTGVEVLRQLYTTVGRGWWVPVTRVPGLAQILDVAYDRFARNRRRWLGLCDDGQCADHGS